MTSANDSQPPVRSSPADEINHYTAPASQKLASSPVLLAAKSAPPAIRAQFIERAALVEILSA